MRFEQTRYFPPTLQTRRDRMKNTTCKYRSAYFYYIGKAARNLMNISHQMAKARSFRRKKTHVKRINSILMLICGQKAAQNRRPEWHFPRI